MKRFDNKFRKIVSKFILLTSILFFTTVSTVQAQNVDLEAVSIVASPGSLTVGATGQVIVSMRNNTGTIPITEATAQITLSSVYLDLGTPFNFVDACSRWSYLGMIAGAGTFNLFFQNNAAAIPSGAACSFQFDIKGKVGTPIPSGITLASSLSATATSSDINGTNQAASTEISVTGFSDLTAGQFFTTTQIAPGGTIEEVVSVRNLGTSATTGQIVFTITTYSTLSGLIVALNPNPTVTIGFTPFTLDNSNWSFNALTGTFTSNPGVFISPGAINARNLGIRITRPAAPAQGANGSVNHTVTITNGTGGGETPTNNNSISNILLKN